MSDSTNTDKPVAPRSVFQANGSLAATGTGALLAYLFIRYQHMHGIDYAAGDETAIAVAITTALGYVHSIIKAIVNRYALPADKIE